MGAKLFKRPLQLQIAGCVREYARDWVKLTRFMVRRLWDAELLGGRTAGEVVTQWGVSYPGCPFASLSMMSIS